MAEFDNMEVGRPVHKDEPSEFDKMEQKAKESYNSQFE